MSKFLITLKYSLINSFAINKLRKKNDLQKYSFGKIFLIIIVGIFLFLSSFLYAFIFGDIFNQVGIPEMILSLGIVVAVMMSLLITITNATGFLFKSKDFDLLMSLPIKHNTIVLTKITYLLLINYFIFAFIYIPALVVYAIFVQTSFVFWVLAIVVFFLGPLFPVAIASFLAYFLSIIIPKFKYKNLITIILSLVAVVLIMVLSFTSSMASEDPSGFSNSIKEFLGKTGEWAYNGIRGDYIQYLYFVLISIIPFILLSMFIGKFYLKANTKFSSTSSRSNYKMEELETKSQGWTLIKKEVRRYFNSPMYVLNTIVGPLLSTVMVVLLGVAAETTLAEFGVVLNDFTFLPPVLVASIVFGLGITSTTASSISIEGKQFWILKSSPIAPNMVFHGKIFVNLLITIPFVILNTILSIIFFKFSAIDYLMVFLIPLLFSVFMSYLGILINLLVPRFDYENDVKAVKQSLSVLLTMGIGFVVVSLMIAFSGLVLSKTNNNLYAYLVGLIVNLIVTFTTMFLLYKIGPKLYKKLVI